MVCIHKFIDIFGRKHEKSIRETVNNSFWNHKSIWKGVNFGIKYQFSRILYRNSNTRINLLSLWLRSGIYSKEKKIASYSPLSTILNRRANDYVLHFVLTRRCCIPIYMIHIHVLREFFFSCLFLSLSDHRRNHTTAYQILWLFNRNEIILIKRKNSLLLLHYWSKVTITGDKNHHDCFWCVASAHSNQIEVFSTVWHRMANTKPLKMRFIFWKSVQFSLSWLSISYCHAIQTKSHTLFANYYLKHFVRLFSFLYLAGQFCWCLLFYLSWFLFHLKIKNETKKSGKNEKLKSFFHCICAIRLLCPIVPSAFSPSSRCV